MWDGVGQAVAGLAPKPVAPATIGFVTLSYRSRVTLPLERHDGQGE
jgi:hypothetical protein